MTTEGLVVTFGILVSVAALALGYQLVKAWAEGGKRDEFTYHRTPGEREGPGLAVEQSDSAPAGKREKGCLTD